MGGDATSHLNFEQFSLSGGSFTAPTGTFTLKNVVNGLNIFVQTNHPLDIDFSAAALK